VQLFQFYGFRSAILFLMPNPSRARSRLWYSEKQYNKLFSSWQDIVDFSDQPLEGA